jgi:hypothetical protein
MLDAKTLESRELAILETASRIGPAAAKVSARIAIAAGL